MSKKKMYEKIAKKLLPQNSTIENIEVAERFGSIFLKVNHVIPKEYKDEQNLNSVYRSLYIRMKRALTDEGAAVFSCANYK